MSLKPSLVHVYPTALLAKAERTMYLFSTNNKYINEDSWTKWFATQH